MKAYPVVLVGCCCILSGCQEPLSSEENLIAMNGVIRQGSMVSVTHSTPGVYPSETLAYANGELRRKIRVLTGDLYADCLLIPQISGYEIVILSKRYLTDAENEQMHRYIEEAIDKPQKETEIYRRM